MPLSGPAIATVALLAGRVESFSRDGEPRDGERADGQLACRPEVETAGGDVGLSGLRADRKGAIAEAHTRVRAAGGCGRRGLLSVKVLIAVAQGGLS